MRARHLVALVVLSLTFGQVHPAAAVIGPVADLSVKAGAWQHVVPGGLVDFDVAVSNAGPFDANNVVVRIAVPANTTFVSWANASRNRTDVPVFTPPPGGTGTVSACIGTLKKPANPYDYYQGLTFLLRVRVDPNATQGLTITTTATVNAPRTADALWCPATTADPAPENNTATATTTVSGPADLAVSASASPDPVTAGSDLTYTLDVTNLGPYDAESVMLSDWFSPSTTLVSFSQESGPAFTLKTTDTGGAFKVTASVGLLDAGATARFTLVVNVAPTVPSYAVIDDDAFVESATGDSDYQNNRGVVETPMAAGP